VEVAEAAGAAGPAVPVAVVEVVSARDPAAVLAVGQVRLLDASACVVAEVDATAPVLFCRRFYSSVSVVI
jgi:hypothetical protein